MQMCTREHCSSLWPSGTSQTYGEA